MEATLFSLSILCCILSCVLGVMWQRERNTKKESVQAMPTIQSDPYEKQIRNLFAYSGDSEGQVKLDED